MLTWNRRDSTPLSFGARGAADRGVKSLWLQDSAFLSEVAVNHLKKARGEIWPKRNERRNNTKKKNFQDEDKKSAINKKN